MLHFRTDGVNIHPFTKASAVAIGGKSVTDKKAYRPTINNGKMTISTGNGVGRPLFDDPNELLNNKSGILNMRGNFDITEVDAKINKLSADIAEQKKDLEIKRDVLINEAVKKASAKKAANAAKVAVNPVEPGLSQ